MLAAADAALEHAARVAAEYRRQPLDGDRRAALERVLSELTAARDPLVAHVRGAGRLYGNPSDPIRAKHRELVAAIRRVRSRLAQSNGTPYRARVRSELGTVATRDRVAARAYRSLMGTLAQYEPLLLAWTEDQEARRRVAGRGDGAAGMRPYRDESRELLDKVNAALTAVRERLAHYDAALDALRRDARLAFEQGRGSYARLHDRYSRHAAPSRAGAVLRRAEAFIEAAGRLRASLYRAVRRTRPYPRRRATPASRPRRGTWTDGAAVAAVDAFRRRHGRNPTKRECNSLPELPPYTTLHRALKASPLRAIDRLSNDNHKTHGEGAWRETNAREHD